MRTLLLRSCVHTGYKPHETTPTHLRNKELCIKEKLSKLCSIRLTRLKLIVKIRVDIPLTSQYADYAYLSVFQEIGTCKGPFTNSSYLTEDFGLR